ncbi:unnamed protein product [Musa textilis]
MVKAYWLNMQSAHESEGDRESARMAMDVNPWSFGDTLATGDYMAATWDYHEIRRCSSISLMLLIFLQQMIEDLRHKLTCTNMELEELRTNAYDQQQEAKETIRQLVELLELRTSERDEARNQLQLLLNQIRQPSIAGLPRVLPHPPTDASPLLQVIGSSNISDDLSETAHPSLRYVSCPVESFVGATAVTSPELSTGNMGGSYMRVSSSSMGKHDQASAVIDSLAMKGK